MVSGSLLQTGLLQLAVLNARCFIACKVWCVTHSCDKKPAVAFRVAGKFNSVCGAFGTNNTDACGLPASAAPQWPAPSGLLSQALDFEKNGSDALMMFSTGLLVSNAF